MPPRRAAGRAPATISHAPGAPANETAWQRFLRTEIYALEKRAGNWTYVTSVGLFVGSIVAVRLWGTGLVPV
ncbi:hypothetical protein DACRYDRAFT_25425 [Dacryopinax primogenitus]|uniref:Uncharacterized protein n=1 Tax=Dacryopinax primogenitus (strain DJM 731) TaxID=1858805 RepID=M5FUR3_DACPD|nr:uncharacterized protein DACRYDRAFT_25425 [Dacryopinax primogenitus]EJT97011.1 hypothetical protein DACRYDRAFT_25425 [Dacryopinax primogenitus]